MPPLTHPARAMPSSQSVEADGHERRHGAPERLAEDQAAELVGRHVGYPLGCSTGSKRARLRAHPGRRHPRPTWRRTQGSRQRASLTSVAAAGTRLRGASSADLRHDGDDAAMSSTTTTRYDDQDDHRGEQDPLEHTPADLPAELPRRELRHGRCCAGLSRRPEVPRTSRRPPDAAARSVPQDSQDSAPGSTAAPQFGQNFTKAPSPR